MSKHFGVAGVGRETWLVPGATHFYPSGSAVVGEDGRRSTLEEAMAAFVSRTLGYPEGSAR